MDPTKDWTVDPTEGPTEGPTEDPTEDPTVGPTVDLTMGLTMDLTTGSNREMSPPSCGEWSWRGLSKGQTPHCNGSSPEREGDLRHNQDGQPTQTLLLHGEERN